MDGKKDYYDVLGIAKTASQEEIKKAYRKLAREHHPDMAKKEDKQAAEKRFKEISEAYQVLSDLQKRKMYDQFGHAGMGQGFPGGAKGGQWGPFTYTYSSQGSSPFGEGFDPFDIFEDIFGFRGFGSRRAPRKGKNLYYDMAIDFKDAVFGLEKEIEVESGKVKIKIPSGVRDGNEIRFAGKGMPGPGEVPNGDLFLSIRVRPQRDFQLVGNNLIVTKEISFVEAALGTVLEVPVVDLENKRTGLGKAKLKVPVGTQFGEKFALRGKGMPKLNGRGKGDVLVQILIKTPGRLSKKQKKLLEEFLES